MYQRTLQHLFPLEASCFILGPRQTGKTTFLKELRVDLTYDLLVGAQVVRLSQDPDLIYRQCSVLDSQKTHLVWIDEIQKIPALLDVVHRTIEEYKNIYFILSGSSARKLRQQGVNLLGGRALDIKFHSLTTEELHSTHNLDLELNYGTLPKVFSVLKEGKINLAIALLNSYITTYLDEEIKKEALVKNLQPFSRFLEVAAQSVAKLINFKKVSEDCQIAYNTIYSYFSILEDTLIGFFLPCYHTSVRKQLVKKPKFYLFDNGITKALLNSLHAPSSGLEKGALYEQFVVQEIRRINDYYQKNFKLFFWRTESGAEVDLLITRGTEILLAIECKAGSRVSKRDISGLRSFKKDHPKVACVVCAQIEQGELIEEGILGLNLIELVARVKAIT